MKKNVKKVNHEKAHIEKPLIVNGTFDELIKVSVSNNPTPKPKKKKETKKK